MGQRLHAVVDQPGDRIRGHDPREIRPLVPQLRSLGQLADDEVDGDLGVDRGPRPLDAELRLGEPFGEGLGVVARTVDRAAVGRHAMLLEALRGLPKGAREPDAGHGRALPPGGDLRQPRSTGDDDAEVGEVTERCREPGRGDDVLRLEPQVAAAVGPTQVHRERPVAALDPLDPVDGRVDE